MYRILLVEDCDMFRNSLVEVLRSHFPSARIEEASDGRTALSRVAMVAPDVVFLDIQLPGENGLEVAKMIKKAHSLSTIVMLTGYDLPEYRCAAREAGADYFVAKHTTSAEGIVELAAAILRQ